MSGYVWFSLYNLINIHNYLISITLLSVLPSSLVFHIKAQSTFSQVIQTQCILHMLTPQYWFWDQLCPNPAAARGCYFRMSGVYPFCTIIWYTSGWYALLIPLPWDQSVYANEAVGWGVWPPGGSWNVVAVRVALWPSWYPMRSWYPLGRSL